MNRHERRRALSIRKRNATTAAETGHASKPNRALGYQFNTASPRVLLLGTALASTFLLASIAAPSTAQAQSNCTVGGAAVTLDPAPDPIRITPATTPPANGPIVCVNTEARTRGADPNGVIHLETNGDSHYIDLTNTESLIADPLAGRPSNGIGTYTFGQRSTITVTNTGDLVARSNDGRAKGLESETRGLESSITITNRGSISSIASASGVHAYGIRAVTRAEGSGVTITNSASVTARAYGQNLRALGLYTLSNASDISITITNSGEVRTSSAAGGTTGIVIFNHGDRTDAHITNTNAVTVTSYYRGDGVSIQTPGSDVTNIIDNSGAITVTSESGAYGLSVATATRRTRTIDPNTGARYYTSTSSNGSIAIRNSAEISVNGKTRAAAIVAQNEGDGGSTDIANTGALNASSYGPSDGIVATPLASDSDLTIVNRGDIMVTSEADQARGINSFSRGTFDRFVNGTWYRQAISGNSVRITNYGTITTIGGDDALGIAASIVGSDSPHEAINRGTLNSVAGDRGAGIFLATEGTGSTISVTNSGAINADAGGRAEGIYTRARGASSAITITNRGLIDATGGDYATGIAALALQSDSPISINNSGAVNAESGVNALGPKAILSPNLISKGAFGIFARSGGPNSPIDIVNTGSVYAAGPQSTGIYATSDDANQTTITNTGTIGAQSHLAIDVRGAGTAHITNAGTITGYVDLTDQDDRFENRSGGVFETKRTSFFGGGNDLFLNRTGATVLGASDGSSRESSGFQGLETFRNSGTISLVDGGVGDIFTLANTPGEADLDFEGGGFVAVDANLAGPGSQGDSFIVDGNVSGVTRVVVNNASSLPGVLNADGIPIIYVEGATPNENNFVLADGPVSAGLFDYDLFFVPTGSGVWELRSFVSGAAYALPKLLTAAQDLWHQTSATWFDRTADLRVILQGGASPAYNDATQSLGEPGQKRLRSDGLTPAVWMKGGGSRLDRDRSATTSAYGRTYTYDLDNEFSSFDLQVGVDMGQYDVISQGDVLIFGVLGGFVGGKLDYDSLADTFDFSGGQVGAYATYLKDGLFVDTLLNVHLYEINTPNFGFPDSLDATTVGLRTDAGYRFGSFTGGAFFEPLATIEVTWADIDGFSAGGNRVSFSDDANVRGRIGGRVGTTMQAWEGTMMEPFLIASLWGNLSDDNSARLVSSGTTFNFQDDLDDVWGEISGGVNLFNFSQTTSVFAKVDYTFGENDQGVGGKGGIRVAW